MSIITMSRNPRDPIRWDERACQNHPPELFFSDLPSAENGRSDLEKERQRRMVERAKAVCDTCPIQQKCHEFAVANKELGIWGGTTSTERGRRLK